MDGLPSLVVLPASALAVWIGPAVDASALAVGTGPDTVAWAVDGLADVVLQSDDDNTLAIVAGFFIGLYLVYDGFTDWQEMRLMQDTPTENVRSAAVGRTEITGTGNPIDEPLDRPFGDGDCLVATYEIEEWREDSDDHGGGQWDTVEEGAHVAPFIVDDGTGRMRVEPDEGATVEISHDHRRRIRVNSGQEEPPEVKRFLRNHADEDIPPKGGVKGLLFSEDRRYTEQWIPPGEDIYLLGAAEPTDDVSATQGEMLELRRDPASDEFIISEESEQELVEDRKRGAPLKIVGGLGLSAVTLFFFLARFVV